MNRPSRRRSFVHSRFLLLPLLFTPSLLAADSNGIVKVLERKYQITEMTSDFEQITKDGTTLVMKCPGIYSLPNTALFKPDNKVVHGKIQSPSSFTKMTWTNVGAHVLQTGEKVYVTKMEANSTRTATHCVLRCSPSTPST